MSIQDTLTLHREFLSHVGGDVGAAATLALVHTLRQQPAADATAKMPRYMTGKQAAEYLCCSVKSLYRQVELGRLVPLRGPKRSYRFTPQMLDRYLAA